MRNLIPNNLKRLANACPVPLYLVGGSVRDFLARKTPAFFDYDICAPLAADEFIAIATACRFTVKSVFRSTGTVKLQDLEGIEYEYSSFRSDKYVRGLHVPVEIYFTNDITLDAKRRDFTVNAIYYDIKEDTFGDPLNGIPAIKQKRLTTVDSPKKVFGEDGLRLMRLARQTAQLGFHPDDECLHGATQNASLIKDITPERIYAELSAILNAAHKYGNTEGAYQGLTLLERIGVLGYILPELQAGKGMAQRADFHKYDVLEHSLRAVKYADEKVRLAALLHDVGKPFTKLRDGNSYAHPTEGARIATEILTRLNAPKKEARRIASLVEWHMYDFDCKTSENKLRRFFVEHYEILEDLLLVKQADYSACMDDTSVAPTCKKWQTILEKMRSEQAPFTLKELAFKGNDALAIGIQPSKVSFTLHALLLHAAVNPLDNTKERLAKLALHLCENPKSR